MVTHGESLLGNTALTFSLMQASSSICITDIDFLSRIQQHIGKTNTHNSKPIRDAITPKSRLRRVIYAMHVSLSRGGPIHYPLLSWSRRLNSFFTANHMSPVCPIPSLVSRSIMSV
ncbi:hypothetical protein FOYG_04824 [Fusarium oxysporum NRRL 32931]|uniref:Uncharacterized protein n=1 Tax=Fusarium oxysporum NRRL 32931 TaxID=660029 RepID=W9ITA4_FUSOX|nr:hypothetical protein FOYG_04824 [Fusarium oxysporum NRRL 32931]